MQRFILTLKVGQTFTEAQTFDDLKVADKVEVNVKQNMQRIARIINKRWGDEFEFSVFRSMNDNYFAAFCVMTKTKIGAKNPFLKKELPKYEKRGRPKGTVTGYDIPNLEDL